MYRELKFYGSILGLDLKIPFEKQYINYGSVTEFGDYKNIYIPKDRINKDDA